MEKFFYEQVKSKISGMLSMAHIDISEHSINLPNILSLLSSKYIITNENYNFNIRHSKIKLDTNGRIEKNSYIKYNTYFVIDNSIYVDIMSENDNNIKLGDGKELYKIKTINLYTSQVNNNKLLLIIELINKYVKNNDQ